MVRNAEPVSGVAGYRRITTVELMFIQLLGWCGAVLLIAAYGGVTVGRVAVAGTLFQGLNLAGAILLGISSAALGAWFSVGLNVFWSVVAVVGITRSVQPR